MRIRSKSKEPRREALHLDEGQGLNTAMSRVERVSLPDPKARANPKGIESAQCEFRLQTVSW